MFYRMIKIKNEPHEFKVHLTLILRVLINDVYILN